jgi:hypothetical protein
LAVFLIPVFLLTAHATPGVTIVNAPESGIILSEEGKTVIEWVPEEISHRPDLEFELQQSTRPDFKNTKTLYQGPDLGTVVTGLAEGNYFYRVREVTGEGTAGEWTEPLTVRVVYPGRRAVTLLLVLGSCVLMATLAAVGFGHLRTADERSTA